MHYEYRDKQGNLIYAVSSTIPGVFIVPPGKNIEDAKEISQVKFKQHLEVTEKKMKAYKPRDVHAELDALKKQLANLKPDKSS